MLRSGGMSVLAMNRKKIKFKKIRSRRLTDCEKDLYDQFYSLNLRDAGRMRADLVVHKNDKRAYVTYILDVDNKIAAWALMTPGSYRYRKPECNFYTKQEYRKMGLGTKLVKSVGKLNKQKFNTKTFEYCPYNDRAISFFRSCHHKGIL